MIDSKKDKQRGDNIALAEKIAEAIESSPLSSREVADECHVTPQAVNGWKKTGRIKKEMLGKLADVLKLPLSHFISTGGVEPAIKSVEHHQSGDQVTADEIIELIAAYKDADKKDRNLIMTSAKIAAKRAIKRRGDVATTN